MVIRSINSVPVSSRCCFAKIVTCANLLKLLLLLLFICHKTHIIMKCACKNYKIGRTSYVVNTLVSFVSGHTAAVYSNVIAGM